MHLEANCLLAAAKMMSMFHDVLLFNAIFWNWLSSVINQSWIHCLTKLSFWYTMFSKWHMPKGDFSFKKNVPICWFFTIIIIIFILIIYWFILIVVTKLKNELIQFCHCYYVRIHWYSAIRIIFYLTLEMQVNVKQKKLNKSYRLKKCNNKGYTYQLQF